MPKKLFEMTLSLQMFLFVRRLTNKDISPELYITIPSRVSGVVCSLHDDTIGIYLLSCFAPVTQADGQQRAHGVARGAIFRFVQLLGIVSVPSDPLLE